MKTSDPNALALKIELHDGSKDIIVFQKKVGKLKLNNGLETDACYALLRYNGAGTVTEAHVVRGNCLKKGTFEFKTNAGFQGRIVDVIGDVTGTRQQSALIIKPACKWLLGDKLKDRELIIRITRAKGHGSNNEAYRIEKVSKLKNALIRVDLKHYGPFIVGWHQAVELNKKKKNCLRTNRPLASFANQPWYEGTMV